LDHYLAELSRFPPTTREQEIELAHRARAGDESAVNGLVVANLRFVVSVAKRYRDRGVPFPDLVQEGNIGLMLAARKFDPELGVRFISYAVWWVRQRMLAALGRQGRAVRIPPRWVSDLRAVSRERERLTQMLGRAPTLAELAKASELPPERIEQVLVFELPEFSLDAPVNQDGSGATLGELLANESGDATDAGALYSDLAEHVDRALDTVNPRAASVLRLYYGFGGRREHTYEEVGALLGVSNGRAVQIHDRAILRLRDSEQCEALASLLNGAAPADWDFDVPYQPV
jgi:RNA polymerase primary sigma factor